ncbi:uncharacterized protein BDZ99DRAFT_459561 [Mytilinidion resinicola]|uniref:Ribosomal protein L9 domain-containing protein n=1 Tax=Mytilinidion resinicola TaxID=574789 RepID=A0A6A6Z0X0_9PEZI|nr:uncharacterized protein BDZ99DRAFT_459561 [Mytilinidion resinicola]KAF2813805.1 hypothetical protein BDZ99DRAFT_459561 [Mytilinidion resinicola]
MASIARSILLPQCASCTRRFTRLGLDGWGSLQQQVRGKQKLVKPSDSVAVKLLKNVKGYGRRGAYIPISPAMMRNHWFPQGKAAYVLPDQLKELKRQKVTIERDFEFGMEQPKVEKTEEEVEFEAQHYVRPVEIELLSPARSMELITIFTPSTIDFARQPIEDDSSSSDTYLGASDSADILAAAEKAEKKASGMVGIYGSVTTADVATSIRQSLANNDEAARVILAENDIRFVEGLVDGETSRVKHLGKFKVEIQVKGAEQALIRSVRVLPQK